MRKGSGNLICGILFIITGAMCIISNSIIHWSIPDLPILCGAIITLFGIFVSFCAVMCIRSEKEPEPTPYSAQMPSYCDKTVKKKDYRVFDKEHLESLMGAVFILCILPYIIFCICTDHNDFSPVLTLMFFSALCTAYRYKEKKKAVKNMAYSQYRSSKTYRPWKCSQCDNINSEDSDTCFMCGHKRDENDREQFMY